MGVGHSSKRAEERFKRGLNAVRAQSGEGVFESDEQLAARREFGRRVLDDLQDVAR